VRQPKAERYVGEEKVSKFEKSIEARQVDSGENLVVLIPSDDGGRLGDNRTNCANAVQTYVDSCHCNGRGEEAGRRCQISD
jgi:hypothetical protein